jgi:hypothetical protein
VGWGGGLRGRDSGGDLTNAQYKSNQNCHYETLPPYNEYILIKFYLKKRVREGREAELSEKLVLNFQDFWDSVYLFVMGKVVFVL